MLKKGSTFFSVILRPQVLAKLGFEPTTFRSANQCSANWANQAAVSMKLGLTCVKPNGLAVVYQMISHVTECFLIRSYRPTNNLVEFISSTLMEGLKTENRFFIL